MPDSPAGTPDQPADAAASPEGDEPKDDATPEPPKPTVEDVEASWANRMSARDKAHNAEVEALREERDRIARERDDAKRTAAASGLGDMTEVQRAIEERDRLAKELDDERKTRHLVEQKFKYPKVAAELGDEVFTVWDDGKLAAYETKLGTEPTIPTRIDPNSAPRKGAPVEKPNPTSDDLKADLARLGPDFAAQLRG